MIVLKDAHVAEIIWALQDRERAIIKEAGQEAAGGRWSASARGAHDRNHEALVGFIEERDRYPDTETVVARYPWADRVLSTVMDWTDKEFTLAFGFSRDEVGANE